MYAVVERRLPMPGYITRDLWGFADILVVDAQAGVLAIQATTVANQAARLEKIRLEGRAARWAAPGMHRRLEVWGWARKWALDARGRRRRLWVVTITPYVPTPGPRRREEAEEQA